MWPDLPITGFMRGRAATEDDVRDGNAVFVLRSNDELIGELCQSTSRSSQSTSMRRLARECRVFSCKPKRLARKKLPVYGICMAASARDCCENSSCLEYSHRAMDNQPLHLTAAALPVIVVPPSPAAAAGELWR
jgi:hypothetical protein